MSEEEGQFLNYPWQSFKERILVHHAILFFGAAMEAIRISLPPQVNLL